MNVFAVIIIEVDAGEDAVAKEEFEGEEEKELKGAEEVLKGAEAVLKRAEEESKGAEGEWKRADEEEFK